MTLLVAKTSSRLAVIAACFAPFLLAPRVLANPLNWNERPSPSPGLQWSNPASTDLAGIPLTWQTVNPLDQRAVAAVAEQPSGTASGEDSTTPDVPSAESAISVQQSPWIIGIGGGARVGAGEPTYPLVYGRLGRILDRNFALSLRPRYIFGNSDQQGYSNSDGAFQVPLTLDFKPTSWLSPYLGGGIATNTDSSGRTNGMVSLGADIAINRNLGVDLGLNYIFQSESVDNNNGDFEFTTVLYLRF